jgi:hypothetical protein
MQMFGLFELLWVFDGGVGYRFGVGEELSPCGAAHILLARGGDGAAGSPVPHVREPPWRAKRGTNSSGGKRESESQSTGPGIITSPPCFHSTNFLSAKSQKQQPRKKSPTRPDFEVPFYGHLNR